MKTEWCPYCGTVPENEKVQGLCIQCDGYTRVIDEETEHELLTEFKKARPYINA